MQTWRAKLILAAALVLLWTTAYGEFYQYTDANGMQRFTDNLAVVPPDQRPQVKTYESVKSEPVHTVDEASSKAASSSDGSAPQTGDWNEKIANQANELDRMQVELSKTYRSLQVEREALVSSAPAAGASAEERSVYQNKVDGLNAKIKDYEAQYADFKSKEKAFNDRYKN